MKAYFSARILFALLAAMLLLRVADPKGALGQTFLIDSNQTSITVSGTVLGSTIMSQAPGSLTTRFGGNLQTAVMGSSIQFVGQSSLTGNNSGSWQPKADGSIGSEPANYGATGTTALGSGVAALRNMLLDVISGPIAVNNGQFDSSSLIFFFPSNATTSFAYNVSGLISLQGAKLLTGYATNKVTTLGTVSGGANQQTITIPVSATFVLSLVSSGDTQINLQGKLVAVQAAQAPPFVIQSFAVQNQNLTLQWQGPSGKQFKILATSDLVSWQTNLINPAFSNGTYSWTFPATNPSQFFRLAQ